jgi:hypothetical protein
MPDYPQHPQETKCAEVALAIYLQGMKMTSERRAIDKIFKRRNRYEIPDWQREGGLWDRPQKQALIDSILR